MKPGTAQDVEGVVRSAFARTLSCYGSEDSLILDRVSEAVKIAYCSSRASAGPSDQTKMEIGCSFDTGEMWIGSLRVAVPFRSTGLGRELVNAAEEIARSTGMTIVSVLPFDLARPFWLKMGYQPHRCTSRALSKRVNAEHAAQGPARSAAVTGSTDEAE